MILQIKIPQKKKLQLKMKVKLKQRIIEKIFIEFRKIY